MHCKAQTFSSIIMFKLVKKSLVFYNFYTIILTIKPELKK